MAEVKSKRLLVKGWGGEPLTIVIKPDTSMNHHNVIIDSEGKKVYALHLGKDSISIHSWTEDKPKFVNIQFGANVTVGDKKVYQVK